MVDVYDQGVGVDVQNDALHRAHKVVAVAEIRGDSDDGFRGQGFLSVPMG